MEGTAYKFRTPHVRHFVFWRKGHGACTGKYLYQESYFAEMFVIVSSMSDKAWLHCAIPMQLVILRIFSLFSAYLPVLFAVSTRLCLGDSNRGVSFIFRCLFLWHTFLIRWNAGQSPASICIVLRSNKSTFCVTLLFSNKWHFCAKFYELFLEVFSWVSYSIKTENDAVSHGETQHICFVCVPFYFSFCSTFSVLWPPVFSLSFLSFSFNLSLTILY